SRFIREGSRRRGDEFRDRVAAGCRRPRPGDDAVQQVLDQECRSQYTPAVIADFDGRHAREERSVPVLVLSAGIADIIEEVFRQKLHRILGLFLTEWCFTKRVILLLIK
ncbi:unnamed protein product, partial [Musa acuminata subsp. burmannicoides]